MRDSVVLENSFGDFMGYIRMKTDESQRSFFEQYCSVRKSKDGRSFRSNFHQDSEVRQVEEQSISRESENEMMRSSSSFVRCGYSERSDTIRSNVSMQTN